MAPELEPLLDPTDLARICRSEGDDWIRRGVQKREFPHTRIARKILFTREQAEQIIRLHAVAAQAVPTRDEVAERRSEAGQSPKKAAAKKAPPPRKDAPPTKPPERTAPPSGPERTAPPSGPRTTEAEAAA